MHQPIHSRAAFLVAGLVLVCPAVAAQSLNRVASPLERASGAGATGGLPLQLRAERLSLLQGLDEVLLERVPLPGGRFADLDLERVPSPVADDIELRVDGARSNESFVAADLTLWKGHVVGAEESDVYIGLSRYGSRGWIQMDGEMLHLLASAGPDGDWSRSVSAMWTEDALERVGQKLGKFCQVDELPAPNEPFIRREVYGDAPTMLAQGPPVQLHCRIAYETDFQLFQQFGNLTAEQTYVTTLLAAIGDRYLTQIQTRLEIAYLGLYTTAGDPWVSPDIGGSSIDMLYEFQNAWSGFPFPNNAFVSHFISGANLGGGVAYLDALCSLSNGFAVSGNIDGDVPFPISQGPLNWDFMVVAHELGHNFGSLHTHDECPPVDQCAPSGYWGACQTQTTCITNGTIMSYCHLCPGGLTNITTFFHPISAASMRQGAATSCLPIDCGMPASYCVAAPNSTGFGATMSFNGTNYMQFNDLQLIASHMPPGAIGIFIYASGQQQSVFGNGFLCVGGPEGVFRLGVQHANSSGVMTKNANYNQPPMNSGPGRILAGSTWNFQGWYRNPAGGGTGFNLTNGLEINFCNF